MQFDPQENLAFVIVIYNRQCSESETLAAFDGQLGLRALIVDNSDSPEIIMSNEDFSRSRGYIYVAMGENKGLSCAYNRAISLLDSQVRYVALLDDDTTLPDDYFLTLFRVLASDVNADIFLPTVLASGRMISPCIRRGALFFRADRKDLNRLIEGRRVSAINSGMVLSLEHISRLNGPFDENLFLDCIDHDFMYNQLVVHQSKMSLYPVTLQQRFFDRNPSRTMDDASEQRRRFAIFSRDYIYFCRKNHLGRLIPRIYLMFRAVKLAIRHRSFRLFPLK